MYESSERPYVDFLLFLTRNSHHDTVRWK